MRHRILGFDELQRHPRTLPLLANEATHYYWRITGAPLADIEDLLAQDDYLMLYNAAFAAKVQASDLSGNDQIRSLGTLVRNIVWHGKFFGKRKKIRIERNAGQAGHAADLEMLATSFAAGRAARRGLRSGGRWIP